jgi:hypothetical protein
VAETTEDQVERLINELRAKDIQIALKDAELAVKDRRLAQKEQELQAALQSRSRSTAPAQALRIRLAELRQKTEELEQLAQV